MGAGGTSHIWRGREKEKISFLCEEVVANAKFMPNQNTPKVKPFVEEEEEEEEEKMMGILPYCRAHSAPNMAH